MRHRIQKTRIHRLPSCLAELRIAHALVSPAAFSVQITRPVGRKILSKHFCQALVNIQLGQCHRIAHIENFPGWKAVKIEQMEDRARRVIAMNRIDESPPVFLDHRLTIEKFPQQHTSPRPIDPSQPRHNATGRDHRVLRVQKDFSRFSIRNRIRPFVHQLPIMLRVNRTAGCKKQFRMRKTADEMIAALRVNQPICLLPTPPRSCAMHHRIGIRQRRNGIPIGNITRQQSRAATQRSTLRIPTRVTKNPDDRLPEITGTYH